MEGCFMKCVHCKKDFDGNDFQCCPYCGGKIQANPPVKDAILKNVKYTTLLGDKWKNKQFIFIAGCSLILILFIFFLVNKSDEKMFVENISENNIGDAMENYTNLSGEDRKIATESIISNINKLYEQYNNNEVSYADAFNKLVSYKESGLQEVTAIEEKMKALKESKDYYEKAEESYQKEDYKNAIYYFEKVSEEDKKYDDAKEKVLDSKDKIISKFINEAENYAEKGDYSEAIIKLKDSNLDDEKITLKTEEYLIELQNQVYAEADNLIQAGEYESAISAVKKYVNKLPNMGTFKEKLEEYEDIYITVFIQDAAALAESSKFEEAVALLLKSTVLFGEKQEILDVIEEYKSKFPAKLVNYELINDMRFHKQDYQTGTFKSTWEESFTDSVYMIPAYYNTEDSSFFPEYFINYNYKYLTFALFCDPQYKRYKNKVQILADDVLVYESGWINYKSDTEYVTVDINNCKTLIIKPLVSDPGTMTSVILGDATLHN
jgi:tetratricopeptide (TPR) repeat protein